jgi:hypothetical protein
VPVMRNYDERPAVSLYMVGENKLIEGNPAFAALHKWAQTKRIELKPADIVEITGNAYDRFYHVHSTPEFCKALVAGNSDFTLREYIRTVHSVDPQHK